MAYSEGLLLESEGQYAGAFRQFNQAAQYDPGFAAAAVPRFSRLPVFFVRARASSSSTRARRPCRSRRGATA